jgi:hypothetical protein
VRVPDDPTDYIRGLLRQLIQACPQLEELRVKIDKDSLSKKDLRNGLRPTPTPLAPNEEECKLWGPRLAKLAFVGFNVDGAEAPAAAVPAPAPAPAANPAEPPAGATQADLQARKAALAQKQAPGTPSVPTPQPGPEMDAMTGGHCSHAGRSLEACGRCDARGAGLRSRARGNTRYPNPIPKLSPDPDGRKRRGHRGARRRLSTGRRRPQNKRPGLTGDIDAALVQALLTYN